MNLQEALNFPYGKLKIVKLSLYIAPTSNVGVEPLYIGWAPLVCQVGQKVQQSLDVLLSDFLSKLDLFKHTY